jgi:hypothetical protein
MSCLICSTQPNEKFHALKCIACEAMCTCQKPCVPVSYETCSRLFLHLYRSVAKLAKSFSPFGAGLPSFCQQKHGETLERSKCQPHQPPLEKPVPSNVNVLFNSAFHIGTTFIEIGCRCQAAGAAALGPLGCDQCDQRHGTQRLSRYETDESW